MNIYSTNMRGKPLIVLTATVNFNPLKSLKLVATELLERKFSGTVLVDLLVFNGNENNRFAFLEFDGQKFDRKNTQYFAHIDPNIEIKQNRFFSKNLDYLCGSILSSKEISDFCFS